MTKDEAQLEATETATSKFIPGPKASPVHPGKCCLHCLMGAVLMRSHMQSEECRSLSMWSKEGMLNEFLLRKVQQATLGITGDHYGGVLLVL
jgi:hypothetical protein